MTNFLLNTISIWKIFQISFLFLVIYLCFLFPSILDMYTYIYNLKALFFLEHAEDNKITLEMQNMSCLKKQFHGNSSCNKIQRKENLKRYYRHIIYDTYMWHNRWINLSVYTKRKSTQICIFFSKKEETPWFKKKNWLCKNFHFPTHT